MQSQVLQYTENIALKDVVFDFKMIRDGLFSSDPTLLVNKPLNAYLNIISTPNMPENTYRCYYTTTEEQLLNKDNVKVHGTFYIEQYKQNDKFIVHKLKKYKKIIDSKRYYYTENVQDLVDVCKKSLMLLKRDNTFTYNRYKPAQVIYNRDDNFVVPEF